MESAIDHKAQIRKLESRALQLKLELHDLSEELPIGWEKIPELAERAYKAYYDLHQAKTSALV